MAILPDRKGIEDFVDQEIKYDMYVRPSIEDGYMTRDEYVIAAWVNYYCNENEPPTDNRDDWRECQKAWESQLPSAYREAAILFETTEERVKALFEKSRDIRCRNMPHMKEYALRNNSKS